jgi:hypothetical protein
MIAGRICQRTRYHPPNILAATSISNTTWISAADMYSRLQAKDSSGSLISDRGLAGDSCLLYRRVERVSLACELPCVADFRAN